MAPYFCPVFFQSVQDVYKRQHMADAGAGLDAGYGSPLHAGPDQPRAAPRDQQIHQTVGRHEDVGAFVAGVLYNIHDVRVSAKTSRPSVCNAEEVCLVQDVYKRQCLHRSGRRA